VGVGVGLCRGAVCVGREDFVDTDFFRPSPPGRRAGEEGRSCGATLKPSRQPSPKRERESELLTLLGLINNVPPDFAVHINLD